MSAVLGVRFWKDKVALVAIEGDAGADLTVKFHRRAKLAARATDAERVRWVHNTIVEALDESHAGALAVRIAERDPDQLRAEHDGVTLAAAANRNLEVATFRRMSMLKPLGIGRASGDWAAFPKSDPFVSTFVGDEQEAAMAARAMLNRDRAS
jgi:hypothetical protein